jgi:hypothetical protein
MKNSFKYSILLLLLSFLIATLCCNSHGIIERYTEYPFIDTVDNELNSLDNLQKTLFKYNQVVSENDYDLSNVLQDINSETQPRKYQRLLDSQPEYGNHRPFDARILSDNYRANNTPSTVKGKRTTIDSGKNPESMDAQNIEPQVSGGMGLNSYEKKETSSSGDFYYEPHECIGGWSDWNKDHCGTTYRDRCGIMFKKYEIIEIEKNDIGPNGEQRPGKPCEYKEGMVKYKYCFGGNADDYDSNVDRCGMSSNLCPCKLKGGSLLDGENVYELEDDNCLFELQRECLCPRGYSNRNIGEVCRLEPGINCSLEETGCIYTPPSTGVDEECSLPPFGTQKEEDDFFLTYSSIDGKCSEKTCICPNGVPVDKEYCVIDGQESCKTTVPCNVGYYMSGKPATCKKHSEEVGVYKECSCLNGKPKTEAAESTTCDTTNPSKQIQFCESTYCSDGYIISNDPRKCEQYYSSTYFDNLSCCIPEYDTCKLEETDLEGKNIVRKDPASLYSVLSGKNLRELMDQHNSIGGVTPITSDDLIDKENPKAFLVTKIIQESNVTDDNETQCVDDIVVRDCNHEFKCKPGYSFKPSEGYSSENELRITDCEIRGEPLNICSPITQYTSDTLSDNLGNCLYGQPQYDLTNGRTTIVDPQGSTNIRCMFPSYLTLATINKMVDGDDIDDVNGVRCREPGPADPGSICGVGCEPVNTYRYYPEWNGTCVPVTCTVADEIKELYNIPYDNCPSDNMNCGLNNVTCKNADFEVQNTRKALYCQSPQKVGNDYLTTDFPLIDIGCLRNPPPRSRAVQARIDRMASSGEIIQGDASEQASQRVGPNEDNIGERVDYSGSTSEQQLEFELGRQRQLDVASEQVGERSGALASVIGGDQMRDELDILQGETRSSR